MLSSSPNGWVAGFLGGTGLPDLSLNIAVHYLDDGVLAGDLAAKSGVVGDGDVTAAVLDACRLPCCGTRTGPALQEFEFPGAAIGDASFVHA